MDTLYTRQLSYHCYIYYCQAQPSFTWIGMSLSYFQIIHRKMTWPTYLGHAPMHVLKSIRAQLIVLHYKKGFCWNFSRRLLKGISIERWLDLNILEHAPMQMHVSKSLRSQVIALHYMNRFCSNFRCRSLKPLSIDRWLDLQIYDLAPMHVLKCLHARLIALHFMDGYCS